MNTNSRGHGLRGTEPFLQPRPARETYSTSVALRRTSLKLPNGVRFPAVCRGRSRLCLVGIDALSEAGFALQQDKSSNFRQLWDMARDATAAAGIYREIFDTFSDNIDTLRSRATQREAHSCLRFAASGAERYFNNRFAMRVASPLSFLKPDDE